MRKLLKIPAVCLIILALIFIGGVWYMTEEFKSFPNFEITSEKTSLTNDEVFSWIEQIVSFGPRKPASEGDEKTRAFISERFTEFGLELAEPEPIVVDTSRVTSWSLSLKNKKTGEETPLPAFPVPFPAPTRSETDEAEAVYVGDGAEIDRFDLKGKVAVFEQRSESQNWDLLRTLFFLYDPADTVPKGYRVSVPIDKTEREIHDKVVARGAVGMVGLLSDLQWEADTFCPQLNYGVSKKIPGYWVSPRNSVTVKKWLERGDVTTKMSLAAEQGRSTTYNIWATLPGRTDEYYIVMCHHDSPFANAVQDASGVSVVLALAKHFTSIKNKQPLKRGIIFLAGGGHTLGRLGEMEFVKRHGADILPKVALVISVEHIAKEFAPQPDLSFACSDRAALRMFFTSGSQSVSGIVHSSILHNNFGRSIIMPQSVVKRITGKARGISGEFYEADLPVVGLLSSPPYMFFKEDTPDTVARDHLVPTANVIISILRTADELSLEELK